MNTMNTDKPFGTASHINILVVEERHMLREKISGVLSRMDNVGFVIQTSDMRKMSASFNKCVPDIILIEIGLAKDIGRELEKLRQMKTDLKIVMFADEKTEEYEKAAAAYGADTFIASFEIGSGLLSGIDKRLGEPRGPAAEAFARRRIAEV